MHSVDGEADEEDGVDDDDDDDDIDFDAGDYDTPDVNDLEVRSSNRSTNHWCNATCLFVRNQWRILSMMNCHHGVDELTNHHLLLRSHEQVFNE